MKAILNSPLRALLQPKKSASFTQSRQIYQGTRGVMQQNSLRAAYYRGGTSRAVIFRQEDLPPNRDEWAPIFRGVIGSPDPNGRQLDGLGGGISSLSKVCVVGPSSHQEAEVDYTFVAVGVKDDEVDTSANCGNMTSAIGPFAVEAGLVSAGTNSERVLKIHNTNTGKLIEATFAVEDGEAVTKGDFAIDGVAGTAAKIRLAFISPGGSKTGKILPTGNVNDTFDGLEATCIDVGNPCVFVQASDLNIPGSILPDDVSAHPTLLDQLETVRRKAAVRMQLASDEASVSGSIPKIAIVSRPHAHKILSGAEISEKSVDLVVRAISVGQPHRAVPVTVALALATASKLHCSVVHKNTSQIPVDSDGVTIGHSSGSLLVTADIDDNGDVQSATVFRTARRIMEGTVFWK
ncbi:MAG: hypothetical protein Q9165_000281 [Trypethelium subeluteriae]